MAGAVGDAIGATENAVFLPPFSSREGTSVVENSYVNRSSCDEGRSSAFPTMIALPTTSATGTSTNRVSLADSVSLSLFGLFGGVVLFAV